MLTRDTHIPLLNSPEGRAAVELLGRICLETGIDMMGDDHGPNLTEDAKAWALMVAENDALPALLTTVSRLAEERF